MRATRIIWRGAGAPMPHEWDLTPIPPRDGLAPVCSMCSDAGPRWRVEDAISDNFRPLSHVNRLFPHVVEGAPVSLCAACFWCFKALRLRCSAWFAREDGIWFVARRDLLAALLDPPEPPFVAGAALYGADHGGEAHGWRAFWPGEPRPAGVEILSRLQAKHVSVYAETAYARDRYPLQVDDSLRITVDVARWRDLAQRLGACARALRAGSVGVTDTRAALLTLRAPVRAPLSVHREWPTLTRGLAAHAKAAWWPLLTDLVPLPDAPPRPEKAPRVAAPPPLPAPVPPQPPAPAPAPPAPKARAASPQLSLF